MCNNVKGFVSEMKFKKFLKGNVHVCLKMACSLKRVSTRRLEP